MAIALHVIEQLPTQFLQRWLMWCEQYIDMDHRLGSFSVINIDVN